MHAEYCANMIEKTAHVAVPAVGKGSGNSIYPEVALPVSSDYVSMEKHVDESQEIACSAVPAVGCTCSYAPNWCRAYAEPAARNVTLMVSYTTTTLAACL